MTETKNIKITQKGLGKLAGGGIVVVTDKYLDLEYEISVISEDEMNTVRKVSEAHIDPA